MPNRGADTLLLLSGGIDSAWVLWRRVQAGLVTRTHHVVLADHEGRAEVEKLATDRVLAWIRANGGQHLIHHSESHVDFGSVPWIPQNYYLWAYWAGTLMAAPRNKRLRKVLIPRHSDAFAGGPDSLGAQHSDEAYTRIVETISGRKPELLYPMKHLSKEQVVRSMPRDLLSLCWYCRTPKYGSACGACRTCRQVQPALNKAFMEVEA